MAVGFMGHIRGLGRNALTTQQNKDRNRGVRMIDVNNDTVKAGVGSCIEATVICHQRHHSGEIEGAQARLGITIHSIRSID
jgi:hypothetical protein